MWGLSGPYILVERVAGVLVDGIDRPHRARAGYIHVVQRGVYTERGVT